MNAQEQMESLLKDMYTCLTNGEQIPGKPGKIAVDRSQFMQMLDEIQNTFYAVLRAQSASAGGDAYSAEARKKESRIIGRAQSHAEDVYAASLLYSDGMIGELKTLFEKTGESLEDVMRSFQKEFRVQQELLTKQETELHAQLADMADTGKYLQLIEEENARRGAAQAGESPAGAGQAAADPSDAGPAQTQEDVIVNSDADYFRWKEEQDHLELEKRKQERLEQERLEQERLEQEHLEQERLEQEHLEQERLEQERLEQERLEQERLEQERLEQERVKRERAKRERLEQERLERERAKRQRLEQERIRKEEDLQKTQVVVPEKTADLSKPAAAAAAYRKTEAFDDIGDDWLDDDSALPDEDVLMKAMLAGEMQTEAVPGADPSFTTQGTRSPQSRTENLDVLELDYMDFDEPADLAGLDDLEPIPESGRGRRKAARKNDYDDDDYNDSGSSGKKGGKLKGFLLGN